MYLDKNLVMFLCQFLSAITDVEAGMCWVYLARHKRALAWFADQEMLKYQEWGCVPRASPDQQTTLLDVDRGDRGGDHDLP